MTVDDVIERVTSIYAHRFDDEVAHSEEDALHKDVLSAIASGEITGTVAKACAEEALKTTDIDFARWCA